MNSEKPRVLVTDDEEELTILMGLSLRKGGFDVDTALDGLEALEKIKDAIASGNPYVVLVTDQMMPYMNGQDLLRKARALDNSLEVIVITAAGSLQSAITAMRDDGAYDYLLKPLESMKQLNMAVERAATHRQLLKDRQGLQQRMGLMLANSGDAIISADENGRIEFINQAALTLCRKTDLQNKDALQNLPNILSQLVKNWRSAGSNQPAMVEINWLDNSVQMVQLDSVRSENGDDMGWIMILRNVTHLKQLDEMRTKMLASVANQVRAPLAEAMNHLVKLNLLTAHDPEVGEIISRLTQIWGHIHKWGNDLSDVVSIGKAPKQRIECINLHSVLSPNRLKPTELLVKKWGCKLTLGIQDELPNVYADPALLTQLMKGLVNRAVSRSNTRGEVKISTRLEDDQVWIDISDEGPPVKKTDLPYIFEKSFGTDWLNQTATGLEMAKVKTILDRMGGQVWVRGEPDAGNTISICLPTTQKQ